MRLFVFFALLFFIQNSYSCSDLKVDKKFTEFMNGIKKTQTLMFWNNYSHTDEAFIVLHDSFPKCIGFITPQGQIIVQSSAEAYKLEDWISFNINEVSYPPIPDLILSLLKDNGTERAIGITIDSKSKIESRIELARHEAFHAYFQEDFKPDWVIGGVSGQRDELNKNCYSRLFKDYKKELATLLMSYEYAKKGNRKSALKEFSTFISLRKNRYKKLPVIDGLSCEEAEATMEYIEGSAEFIGLMHRQYLEPVSWTSFIKSVRGMLSDFDSAWYDPFYYFGSVQFALLKELEPAAFNTVINSYLSNSDGKLYLLLEKEILK